MVAMVMAMATVMARVTEVMVMVMAMVMATVKAMVKSMVVSMVVNMANMVVNMVNMPTTIDISLARRKWRIITTILMIVMMKINKKEIGCVKMLTHPIFM